MIYFDLLGFHLTPTGITPLLASIEKRDNKLSQLYEQDASENHIGKYLNRWSRWATVCFLVFFHVGNANECDDLRTYGNGIITNVQCSEESNIGIFINGEIDFDTYVVTIRNITYNNVAYCVGPLASSCTQVGGIIDFTEGLTYVFKNLTDPGGDHEYFATTMTGGTLSSPVLYTFPSTKPSPTAVPLSPFSKLLLALLFIGASLMMLRKKRAKV